MFSVIELFIEKCTATMNKDYAQLHACMNRVIKTYSRLDQKFTFHRTIYDRRWDKTTKVNLGFVSPCIFTHSNETTNQMQQLITGLLFVV